MTATMMRNAQASAASGRGVRAIWLIAGLVLLSVLGGVAVVLVEGTLPKVVLTLMPVVMALLAVIVRWRHLDGLIAGVVSVAALMSGWLAVRLVPDVTVADLVLVMAALLVAIKLMQGGRSVSLHSVYLPLAGIALIALGGLIGGVVGARNLGPAMAQLGRFTASTALVLILFALWDPHPRTVRWVLWAYLIGAAASATIALYEVQAAGGRPIGLSTHSNHLAIACVLSLGVGLALVGGGSTALNRVIASLLMVPIGLAIVASGSRAGLLGALTVFATFVLLSPRRVPTILATVTVMGGAAILVGLALVNVGSSNAITRAFGDASAIQSDAAREDKRESSLGRVNSRPITGSGFEDAQQAHSLFIQVWDAAGVAGIVGMALILAAVLRVAVTALRRRDWMLAGLASAVIAYFVGAVFQNQIWDRYIWLVVSLAFLLERRPSIADTSISHVSRSTGAIQMRDSVASGRFTRPAHRAGM